MTKRILHISDLHIWDPKDTDDFLRQDYYDEYLKDLHKEFANAGVESRLDAIFATGDFIDRGQLTNFAHAKRVLKYAAQLWEVPEERIVTCIGNHDIDRAREKKGEWKKARQAYQKFAAEFAKQGHTVGRSAAARVGLLGDGLGFISIDSTREGNDQPGILPHADIDSIIAWIKAGSEGAESLVICSHFPVDVWAASLAPFEDPGGDWYRRHVWANAGLLRERIIKNVRVPTIWLSGDIHREAVIQDGNIGFSTIGRLGVSAKSSHGETRRQASIVELDEPGDFRLWRAEWRAEGRGNAQLGKWEVQEVQWPKVHRPEARSREQLAGRRSQARSYETIVVSEAAGALRGETEAEEGSPEAEPQRQARLPLLMDEEYERELVRQIAEDGLYRFGRFETGVEGQISLGWVSLEGLCGINGQLEPIVKRMASWVAEQVLTPGGISPTEALLIGMDCWGAIFASQLSVKLGSPFLPVASRAEGRYGTPGETIDEEFMAAVRVAKAIILVTDVVGTGRSLAWVFNEVSKVMGEWSGARWFAVSLICDAVQHRGPALDFLESHASLCINLRMPLLQSTALPPRDVLPPAVSF